MISFNKKRNTLEQETYHYELQDVAEPNLFRAIFPYTEPPKVPFNHRLVPMDPPEEIWITDTTFRDGQQSRPPFSVKQIVDLYTMLHRLSGPEWRDPGDGVLPLHGQEQARPGGLPGPGLSLSPRSRAGFGRTRKTSSSSGRWGCGRRAFSPPSRTITSSSSFASPRRQVMEGYLDIVRAALEAGVVPRCHLEDITRADFYGFVVPFVQELMRLAEEAKMPIKVRACDTLGYGVTYPGATIPRSVNGIMYGLVHHAGVPSEWLEWHGHNDFYKVLTNASTAWLYGCSAANGTLLGIGERTGNTPIEGLVFEYMGLRGTDHGMQPQVITEIAEYFQNEIGMDIPPNQPFVGETSTSPGPASTPTAC